jgi:hypothetical protein
MATYASSLQSQHHGIDEPSNDHTNNNDNATNNLNNDSNSDSDVWDTLSTTSEVATTPISCRDLQALQRRHENRGYLDGLTKGNEAGLQKGFDDGYPVGAQLGGLVGELVADTICRSSWGQIDESTKNQALDELKISNILNAQHFDVNLDLKNPRDHPIIKKWTSFYDKLGFS